MKKAFNIINITMIILVVIGVIFGSWKDRTAMDYLNNGLFAPRNTFCFYDRLEAVIGGIICIWWGIVMLSPSIKSFPSKYFAASLIQLLFAWGFGVVCLIGGAKSFWEAYSSNLPNCVVR